MKTYVAECGYANKLNLRVRNIHEYNISTQLLLKKHHAEFITKELMNFIKVIYPSIKSKTNPVFSQTVKQSKSGRNDR